MEIIIPILIALVAIALVWKLLAGIVKTVALVAIAVSTRLISAPSQISTS